MDSRTMTLSKDQKRLARADLARGVPIAGFTGINGAGKTLAAVQSAIHDLSLGRDVYSTVPITSEYGDSKPITSVHQLLGLRDSTFLLDDVSVIFPSGSTGMLSEEVKVMLQTVRHKRNTIRWTAPAWMRCNNLVREVTQGLINVVPMWRYSDGVDPWPRPRFVLAGLLDTTEGKTDETPTRVLRRRLFVPSRLDSFGAYDTRAETPLLGERRVPTRCPDCHGTIDRPKHTAERHAELEIPYYAL